MVSIKSWRGKNLKRKTFRTSIRVRCRDWLSLVSTYYVYIIFGSHRPAGHRKNKYDSLSLCCSRCYCCHYLLFLLLLTIGRSEWKQVKYDAKYCYLFGLPRWVALHSSRYCTCRSLLPAWTSPVVGHVLRPHHRGPATAAMWRSWASAWSVCPLWSVRLSGRLPWTGHRLVWRDYPIRPYWNTDVKHMRLE